MLAVMNNEMKISFGSWLYLKRRYLGLSQADIANALEIRSQTVSNWECDRTIPKLTLDQFGKLQYLLQVTFEEMIKAGRNEIETSE